MCLPLANVARTTKQVALVPAKLSPWLADLMVEVEHEHQRIDWNIGKKSHETFFRGDHAPDCF